MAISQDFPSISPTLNLNFARSRSLDPRVTFTRSSSATRVNPLGVVELVRTNTPRFDHSYNSATGAVTSLGLLIEDSRANQFQYSDQFDSASSWYAVNLKGTMSPNQTTAPDGQMTADLYSEDTTSSTRYITRTISFTSGTSYTMSIWAKRAPGSVRYLGLVYVATSFDATCSAIFDLSGAGAFNIPSSGTSTSASIQAFPNGWYRCTLTSQATITASSNIQIRLCGSTTSIGAYQGDGASGIYIWGAQLETGTFPTSYVPSTQTFTSRASSATYFDSTGTLQTAATNVARTVAFLPDSGGVFRSAGPLLLEEARTNYVRNNTMVGAVAGTPGTLPTNWGIDGNSGLSSQVGGISTNSGITYIDIRFFGTVASVASPEALIYFEQMAATSVAPGQTWTASCYAKIVGGTQTGILNGEVYIVGYNSTLTLSEASPASFLYSSLTNTFSACRVAKTYTFTSAGTIYARHRIDINFTAGGGSVVDFTIRIGMPQFEQGAYATSVITTSSSTVTRSADASSSSIAIRSADNASIVGTNFSRWYNQTEGTIYANIKMVGVKTTQYDRLWAITNSNFNLEGISAYIAGPGALTAQYVPSITATSNATEQIDGSIYPNITAISVPSAKHAFAFKANSANMGFNGVVRAADDTSVSMLSADADRLFIGQPQRFQGYSCMTVSQLSYYPRRLSNTQLQALTK